MKKLLIIIAILAIAGAAWAGGLLVGPSDIECGPTISPGCPSDHVYVYIQKEKSCRDETKSVIVSSPDAAELNNLVSHGWRIDRITGPFGSWKGIVNYTIWLKRRVCE